LPKTASKDDLFVFVSNFGKVDEIDFPKLSDGTPKGYATVIMTDEKTVKPAMDALNGKVFDGVALRTAKRISEANPSFMANYKQSLSNYAETSKRVANSVMTTSLPELEETSESILEGISEEFISSKNIADQV